MKDQQSAWFDFVASSQATFNGLTLGPPIECNRFLNNRLEHAFSQGFLAGQQHQRYLAAVQCAEAVGCVLAKKP